MWYDDTLCFYSWNGSARICNSYQYGCKSTFSAKECWNFFREKSKLISVKVTHHCHTPPTIRVNPNCCHKNKTPFMNQRWRWDFFFFFRLLNVPFLKSVDKAFWKHLTCLSNGQFKLFRVYFHRGPKNKTMKVQNVMSNFTENGILPLHLDINFFTRRVHTWFGKRKSNNSTLPLLENLICQISFDKWGVSLKNFVNSNEGGFCSSSQS